MNRRRIFLEPTIKLSPKNTSQINRQIANSLMVSKQSSHNRDFEQKPDLLIHDPSKTIIKII